MQRVIIATLRAWIGFRLNPNGKYRVNGHGNSRSPESWKLCMLSDPSTTAEITDVSAISGLSELWAETLGDPRICIAVLDGPVDLSHPSTIDALLDDQSSR